MTVIGTVEIRFLLGRPLIKKSKYAEVSDFVQSKGVTLQSLAYKTSRDILKFICKCGTEFTRTFFSFKHQNAYFCKTCSGAEKRKRQQLSYNDIKEYIENRGATLISTDYINSTSKLELICECACAFSRNWQEIKGSNIKNKVLCRTCASTYSSGKRKSYEKVKSFIESNGTKLLSQTYKSNTEFLKLKCLCGSIFLRKYKVIKKYNSFKCIKCSNAKKSALMRHDYVRVKKYINATGCTLLTTYYSGNKQNLEIKCRRCDRRFTQSFFYFQYLKTHQCQKCSGSDGAERLKIPFEVVKNTINSTGCLLISKEYSEGKSLLTIQCNCGKEFKRPFFNFRGNKPCCPACSGKDSKPELELRKFIIEELGIDAVITNTKKVITPLELDIYIPKHNIAFEMNGLHWHGEKYGEKTRYYHRDKYQLCEDKGIRLIQITDFEWSTLGIPLRNYIKNIFTKGSVLYARNCEIKEITNGSEKDFLTTHHLQGSCSSAICFGLYHRNDLVSVMTFSRNRFSNKWEYELVRYCVAGGINVVGGANKLFKAFIKTYNPTSIVSYCDLSKFVGGVYENLGFFLHHTSKPGFFYFKSGQVYSRQVFQKHKLEKRLHTFNSELSEWQNMKNCGFDRYWNCGNKVFVWKCCS